MSQPIKKLVLIDGHSNLHKAYHAIQQTLTNSRGEPTSAVYGFIAMFLRLHRQMGFSHVIVVFDPHGPTFREAIYPAYKANRPPAPEDLIQQDRRVRRALEIMKVPVIEKPGFEADDVIGALALRAVEQGGEALVCSSDKDLLQLVRPGVRIWREHLQKADLMDEAAVVEKLGVRPDQVPAYLGLVGDTSDNIPGVPGVGPKTAAALLNEYDNIDAILAAAPAIPKKKLSENLQQFAEQARLSERLATLDTSCIDAFDWDQFLWEYKPSDALRDFYREMEFQSFLNELGGETVEDRTVDYGIVRTREELARAVTAIRKSGLCAIDTETTDLDPFLADLVGISLSWKKNQAVYIPIGHGGKDAQLPIGEIREQLAPLLVDASVRWVAHNWNFDYKILRNAGFNPGSIAADTMVQAYLLSPERTGSLRLKELALSILGIKMTEIRELIGDGDDMVTMASVTVEDTAQYACQDADATLQLFRHFDGELDKAGMKHLLDTVDCPLIPVLAEMELEGIRIDTDHFRRLSAEATKDLAVLEKEIYEIAGRPFNINSPRQVAEILFGELGLTGGKKGKTGTYSTDVSVLEGLKNKHPLPAKLLEYRQIEKLKNTYIDPLPTMVHPRTRRVHSSFSQTVAATGRLSSSNPNLQNIPVRTEAGRRIREGFIPREEGWKLLAADYSQIELRILAHLSGDEALREAFTGSGDIHRLTASKVFGVAYDDVTSEMRGQAKAINFGIIYGMTSFRLSRDLGISRPQADRFIEDYFKVYSGVRDFIERTREQARESGHVTTLKGRRRFVADINARNANQRAFAERIAVNTPIQGTSADMIKMAMIRVARRLGEDGYRARMVLQVHDELIFDVPEEEIETLSEMVTREMADALPLDVPIKVYVKVGANWAEC